MSLSERVLLSKTQRERDDFMKTKSILESMKQIYDIFGSVALIHTKYANLQLYVIKRLTLLKSQPDDFNMDGGSKLMTYQG